MEYVKDAIEKARKDRQAATESGAEPVSAEQSPSSGASTGGAKNVQYTQTRSIELDQKHLKDNRVVAAFESDVRTEPYRQLRTQILRKFRENDWRTLAITSAEQGAGKTLTAVNLAIALSREVNQTVLLADMDLQSPSILEVLGIRVERGLVDHLQGDVPLEDILVNPGLDRLSVLPALPFNGATSEILSSPKMKGTLDEIVNRYDDRFIIFDLPPLLRDDDALVFTPYADATILVVENGVTTPDDLERCMQLLQGTNVIGTVLNKAD